MGYCVYLLQCHVWCVYMYVCAFEVQYVIYGNEGCGQETRALYGSQDHSPSSHKSHIELQTHIMCFIVTFPELACHYRMRKR